MRMMMQMLMYLALIAGAVCLFAIFYMKIDSVSDFRLVVSKLVNDNPSTNLMVDQKWTEANSMHSTNQVIERRQTTPASQKAKTDGQENLSQKATTVAQDVIFEIIGSSLQNHSNDTSQCLKRSELIWSDQPLSTISCPSILTAVLNDTDPINQMILSNATTWNSNKSQTDESISKLAKNCNEFLSAVPFQTVPKSQEESDYPLAYVFVPHRNLGQTIRLFRMLYHPQNAYCISYDAKSDQNYIQAILDMASCFPSNIYINPYPEPIYYTDYSLLRSVMNCVRVLANSTIPWKYVQVVSWNDFPLKTNLELVRIAKILNGSQDCELRDLEPLNHIIYKNKYKSGSKGDSNDTSNTAIPPGGLIIYKGSFANYLSREFVDFTFSNPLSIAYYEYLADPMFAEEFYWTTLVHNTWLGAPGGFPGQCEIFYKSAGEKKPFFSRYQVWQEWDESSKRKCKGKWINVSCVFGILDMPMLIKRMELIAHKMYEEFEPALLYCMEEWYWERVCNGENHIDWEYYQNLPSVKYHHLSEKEKDTYVCKV